MSDQRAVSKRCQLYLILILCLCYSFSKVQEQKEQLEQKHLHLLQILDSERQAKWHYVQQTEELTVEVKKLKNEVSYSFFIGLELITTFYISEHCTICMIFYF